MYAVLGVCRPLTPSLTTMPTTETFSFSTRIGMLLMVQAACMSAIAVTGLLSYIAVSPSFDLHRFPVSYFFRLPVQGSSIPKMADGDADTLLLSQSPCIRLGASNRFVLGSATDLKALMLMYALKAEYSA
jgi:hypothetical protein